jgi:hypothetical protein
MLQRFRYSSIRSLYFLSRYIPLILKLHFLILLLLNLMFFHILSHLASLYTLLLLFSFPSLSPLSPTPLSLSSLRN